jgi:16S rRNA (cytosine1402-N4)-methyltransferase
MANDSDTPLPGSGEAAAAQHVAVLLEEAVEALAVRRGGLYVDATFGAGGHARAIAARGGRVLAFDLDPAARVPDDLAGSVTLVRRSFAQLGAALDELGETAVDGVLFDLGVSSMQFDRGERGFSLQHDGPLDMRMNWTEGTTAYDLLARTSESELADLIFEYGEERAARRIARAIVAARAAGRLPTRTLELARLVAGVVHVRGRRERIHPATRTFQALRIAVNDELGALRSGLDAAVERTRPGGRIAVISFHSLEDRIVKQKFRDNPRLRALTKKPVIAGEAELERNPRARSAKLRVAEPLA